MADDNPDTSNMFAGIKKKKKKTVQIADLELDGEDQDTQKNSEPVAAKATKAAAAAQQDEDAVRPLESSADLTLKDEDPLDFSDLKKVHCGGQREAGIVQSKHTDVLWMIACVHSTEKEEEGGCN
jgi:hypothetical protein